MTYIDSAYPDKIPFPKNENENCEENPKELINFEKRRKEFEVLAKIKLFQSAARDYHIVPNLALRLWLIKLPELTEQEWYVFIFLKLPELSE